MHRTVSYKGNFTFLFSVYTFNFIVCDEQPTFIYKELRSP